MPTVTLSGISVETDATAQRTVACEGTLLPRSRAQDVAGAFGSSDSLTQCTTTFKLETALAEVKGDVKASDAYDARIEVAGTWTDPVGSLAPTAGTNFTITSAAAASNPDSDYRSVTATATGLRPILTLPVEGRHDCGVQYGLWRQSRDDGKAFESD